MKQMYSYSSMTLHDVLIEEPTLLDDLVLETEIQTSLFKQAFISRYNLYDIGGETIPLFKLMIKGKFDLNKNYYQQLITEYVKSINYEDGYKEIETITEENDSTGTSNQDSDGMNTNKRTFYDLPYKQTSERYATTETIDDNTSNVNIQGTYSSNDNKNITKTKTGNVNVLEQKIKYMKFIRDIYRDFVEVFRECFSLIYG